MLHIKNITLIINTLQLFYQNKSDKICVAQTIFVIMPHDSIAGRASQRCDSAVKPTPGGAGPPNNSLAHILRRVRRMCQEPGIFRVGRMAATLSLPVAGKGQYGIFRRRNDREAVVIRAYDRR